MEPFVFAQFLFKTLLAKFQKGHDPPIILTITLKNGQRIKNAWLKAILFNKERVIIKIDPDNKGGSSQSVVLKECQLIDVENE